MERFHSFSVKGSCAEEAIALFCHACFLSKGFLCIGAKEDDWNEQEGEIPEGFSEADASVFSFKYRHGDLEGKSFLLRLIKMGNKLMASSVVLEDEDRSGTMQIKVADVVDPSLDPSAMDFFKGPAEFVQRVEEELVAPLDQLLLGGGGAGSRSRRERSPLEEDPLRDGPRVLPGRGYPLPDPESFIPGVGAEDLYPDLGFPGSRFPRPGGGGNVVGPGHPLFGGNGVGPANPPRPSINHPPGARFDPFGPFGGIGGDPDPDGMGPFGGRGNPPPPPGFGGGLGRRGGGGGGFGFGGGGGFL